MPAQIALILCIALVLFLLRLEHKQYPEASLALWIPTIWMVLTNIKPLGIWFRSGGTMETGSPIDRSVLTVLLCVSLFILLRRNFNLAATISDNYWLMILIVFMLVSILWSPMPSISLKRWVRELGAIVIAFLISSEQNPLLAIKSILRRTIYILLPFSLLLIKFYPYYGRQYGRWDGRLMWTGVSSQKNGLALLCVISVLFLLWVLWQRRRGYDTPVVKYQLYVELSLIILAFYLMAGPQRTLSYSATSLVSLIVGISTFVGLIHATKRGIKISSSALSIVVGLIILYGTITPFIGKLTIWDLSGSVSRSDTLTGRSNIWSTLIPFFKSRPIAGHGVGGFWTTEIRRLTSSHAHNGYLDTLLHFGFLGLALIILFILSCARKALDTLAVDIKWGTFFICFMLITLVHNIAESSIYTFTTGLTALILFLSINVRSSVPISSPSIP